MGEFPVKDEALRDSMDHMLKEIYSNLSKAAIIINDRYKKGDINHTGYCFALEALFKCLKDTFNINMVCTQKRPGDSSVRVYYKNQLIGELLVTHSITDLHDECVFVKEITYKKIQLSDKKHIIGLKMFGFKSLLFQLCEATPKQKYKLEKLIFDMI